MALQDEDLFVAHWILRRWIADLGPIPNCPICTNGIKTHIGSNQPYHAGCSCTLRSRSSSADLACPFDRDRATGSTGCTSTSWPQIIKPLNPSGLWTLSLNLSYQNMERAKPYGGAIVPGNIRVRLPLCKFLHACSSASIWRREGRRTLFLLGHHLT